MTDARGRGGALRHAGESAGSAQRPRPKHVSGIRPIDRDHPLPGRRIDGWRILRTIGSGGMAEVLLAIRPDVSGPRVLKALHEHLVADGEAVERFVAEGELGLRLCHPNLVRVEGTGWFEGRPYHVLEYVRGVTLATMRRCLAARGQRLGCARAVAIAARVAHALHAAHTARDAADGPLTIVHRDLSPANIMVAADGRVKLLDFGVSKAVGPTDAQPSVVFRGTVRYSAPEQILAKPIGPHTDVYGLGAVLWHLLTGRRLVDGDTLVDQFRAVVSLHAPPPSTFASDVPPEVDAVVLRCLAHDPGGRPPSAEALASALLAACPAAAEVDHATLAEVVRSVVADAARAAEAKEVPEVQAGRRRPDLGSSPVEQEDTTTLDQTAPGGARDDVPGDVIDGPLDVALDDAPTAVAESAAGTSSVAESPTRILRVFARPEANATTTTPALPQSPPGASAPAFADAPARTGDDTARVRPTAPSRTRGRRASWAAAAAAIVATVAVLTLLAAAR